MLVVLWLHVPALFVFSVAMGYPLLHSLLDCAPPAIAAIAAHYAQGRKLRSAIAATGLLSCSALTVHISGGYIEGHFDFFVMIVVLTLYEDWIPFLLATFYVVLHHGIGSAIGKHAVFNHPDAIAHPVEVGRHPRRLRARRGPRLDRLVAAERAGAREQGRGARGRSRERGALPLDVRGRHDRHVPVDRGRAPDAGQPGLLPDAGTHVRGAATARLAGADAL